MGDFYLPQRGLLVLASARFDRPLPAAAASRLALPRCGGGTAGWWDAADAERLAARRRVVTDIEIP
jgi:hypothetical protein